MILVNNINETFKNTAIILVDSRINATNQVKWNDLIFFVDKENNVESINVLDSAKYNLNLDKKFYSLDDSTYVNISQIASDLGLKIKNEPKFIYGEVLSRETHPKSQKLFVLQVKINDNQTIQIVTNTLDSTVGSVLVLALPGSFTFKGMRIIENKVLNVDSFGMLTGYQTLGIDKEGLIFGTHTDIGKDFNL
ncbi:hypothetical protein GE118_04100 [Mycoplasma sp. NEAQ87857]|uniref:TyrS-associated PheT N-terminal domain-related protein TapR n=1 Tax=Mycoplasma sp. NEAQ87857 TaxID=2683967 RepID=UPI0013193CD6|nr:hypothetical protein [Mycoplasma sp. NEAQ87857]QGZ97958.1 hypothetical protein GE118_04100 [Mycoplasma sp. NEAQ87857]